MLDMGEVSVPSSFFCSCRLFPGGVLVQQVDVRQQSRQRQHCESRVLNSGGVVSDRLKAPEQKERFCFFFLDLQNDFLETFHG